MNKASRWFIVFIVTFAVCVAGGAPVFVTGLFVQEVITHPLTLLVMGLLATLAASWMSNFLSSDSTHSRIVPIMTTTETIAVLLSLSRLRFSPNIVSLVIWGSIISAAACLAAMRFRNAEYNRRRDILVSLVLLALAPAAVVVTIAVASRFGLTGA